MNSVILSGNLTRDPEVRYTQSGKAYARMGLAVNRPFSKDATDFFNLLAWEKKAEFCGKYLKKGSRILVDGRIETGSYEKDGVKHATFDIVIDNVEFGDSKPKDTNTNSSSQPRRDYKRDDFGGEPVDPDDMPF